ncbi:MAG: LCP family protein [Chloroflexi bacterium]|nr:LCP family protein [Chloroflexota bacterium]
MLYDRYRTGDAQQVSEPALEKLKKDVAFALAMEIDYYAFIRFTGFDALMDNVAGVAVNIPAQIVDPYYSDSGSPPYGIKFPDRFGWVLKGKTSRSAQARP